MNNFIVLIEKRLNLWEIDESVLRKNLKFNNFIQIWKSYFILNIKYNFLLLFVNILYFISSIIFIKKTILFIKSNKNNIKYIDFIFKILDNLLLIIFLIFFQLNGFFFFIFIKIIIILFTHGTFLYKNKKIDWKTKIWHLKNETISRNIKSCIEKNTNIKFKIYKIKKLINDR